MSQQPQPKLTAAQEYDRELMAVTRRAARERQALWTLRDKCKALGEILVKNGAVDPGKAIAELGSLSVEDLVGTFSPEDHDYKMSQSIGHLHAALMLIGTDVPSKISHFELMNLAARRLVQLGQRTVIPGEKITSAAFNRSQLLAMVVMLRAVLVDLLLGGVDNDLLRDANSAQRLTSFDIDPEDEINGNLDASWIALAEQAARQPSAADPSFFEESPPSAKTVKAICPACDGECHQPGVPLDSDGFKTIHRND